jgi:hypothetical protein
MTPDRTCCIFAIIAVVRRHAAGQIVIQKVCNAFIHIYSPTHASQSRPRSQLPHAPPPPAAPLATCHPSVCPHPFSLHLIIQPHVAAADAASWLCRVVASWCGTQTRQPQARCWQLQSWQIMRQQQLARLLLQADSNLKLLAEAADAVGA